jgi:paraquat-inducible protein A
MRGRAPAVTMPEKIRAYVLAPVYYVIALVLAVFIIANANDASRAYESISAHETVSAKADRALREALEAISLGLYEGGSALSEQLADALDVAHFHETRAAGMGWLLLGLSTAFLAAVIAGEERGRRMSSPAIIRHLFGTSGVFLLVGLLAPILTVVAHEEIALLGRVVLQYESKGIITTIHKLYLVKSYFLATLLLIFSVLLPVLKILLSMIALELEHSRARRVSVIMIKIIGRWSMTDVFLVAVLLAFLTADTSQLTDATLGPGLYFFAGYGLLSIAAGQLMIGYEDSEKRSVSG